MPADDKREAIPEGSRPDAADLVSIALQIPVDDKQVAGLVAQRPDLARSASIVRRMAEDDTPGARVDELPGRCRPQALPGM